MISQESSYNSQSSQVFQNLHWSIQKIFKISLEEISKKNNKLLNITEDEIPYEKRIYLMKADDYVKQKALEKYKETQFTTADFLLSRGSRQLLPEVNLEPKDREECYAPLSRG